MTTATEKKLSAMSLEELDVYGKELRVSLVELPEGERAAGGDRFKHLLDEVALLDAQYTIARHQDAVERARKDLERNNALGPMGANMLHGIRGSASFTQRMFDAEAVKHYIERGFRNAEGGDRLHLEVSGFLDPTTRNIVSGERAVTEWGASGPGNAATGDVNALLPVGQPIAPVPREARLAMRDLIPSQPTTLTQVPYVRELNPTATEFGASAVAEGNTKPDASPNFVSRPRCPR